MKAIALTPGTKQVRLADWPEPKIETPTQLKLRTIEVGICGTDREEVSGGRADAPIGEKELIIGHEVLAEVVEVGAAVKRFKPKDLAVVMVRRGCGQCEPCKKDRSDFCATGNYRERGIKGYHGFEAQWIVDEEHFCLKVPPSLRSIAVLTEPTTVVEKAIDDACRLQVARLPVDPNPVAWLDGKNVLVAGLGPVGLLASMILRLRGSRVLGLDIVDPHSPRPKLLEAMGGKYVRGNEAAIRQAIETYGQIDMIVEAAGIASLDFELIDMLGVNGVYVLTGVPAEGHLLSLDGGKLMRQLVFNNQLLFGSVNAGRDHFKQALLDLEAAQNEWKGVMDQFITSRTPYADFSSILGEKKKEEIKAVIVWHS
jgi:threonine dehydrogenase-like Zn-dependent dehydrogenase